MRVALPDWTANHQNYNNVNGQKQNLLQMTDFINILFRKCNIVMNLNQFFASLFSVCLGWLFDIKQ